MAEKRLNVAQRQWVVRFQALQGGRYGRDLATVLVRVAEAYAYADLIAGEPPDAERAAAAFALVLAATRPAS